MSRLRKLLNEMRGKETMFIGERTLWLLRAFLDGYRLAMWEDAGRPKAWATDERDELSWFQEFVCGRYYGEESVKGWHRILMEQCASEAEGMKLFWKNWDDFIELLDKGEFSPGQRRE